MISLLTMTCFLISLGLLIAALEITFCCLYTWCSCIQHETRTWDVWSGHTDRYISFAPSYTWFLRWYDDGTYMEKATFVKVYTVPHTVCGIPPWKSVPGIRVNYLKACKWPCSEAGMCLTKYHKHVIYEAGPCIILCDFECCFYRRPDGTGKWPIHIKCLQLDFISHINHLQCLFS